MQTATQQQQQQQPPRKRIAACSHCRVAKVCNNCCCAVVMVFVRTILYGEVHCATVRAVFLGFDAYLGFARTFRTFRCARAGGGSVLYCSCVVQYSVLLCSIMKL